MGGGHRTRARAAALPTTTRSASITSSRWIHRLGPGLTLSLKLAIATAWSGGTLLSFLWLRRFGFLAGLMGAALFAWSPYVMVDGYVRTAYPELLAMCAIPGVLWTTDRLIRDGSLRHGCGLAFFSAVMLTSHLPATVIALPLCAGYALSVAVASKVSWQRMWPVAGAVALGLGLASFYVSPALWEMDAVRMRALVAGYFDFHNHFVPPAFWFDWSWGYGASGTNEPEQMSRQIGVGQWLAVAVAAGAMALLLWRRDRRAWSLAGWLAAFCAALFMMTATSAPIWERVPALSFAQFPWRFLILPATVSAVRLAH